MVRNIIGLGGGVELFRRDFPHVTQSFVLTHEVLVKGRMSGIGLQTSFDALQTTKSGDSRFA